MYDFSLDRKRIILLVSGLVLAAVLLFVAGLTVGLAHSGDSHSQAQASQPSAPLPASQPVQQPAQTSPINQQAAHVSPQPSPIASAASLAPRTETATASARLHAAHAATVASRPAPAAKVHHEIENGSWYLQAGAFSREANATALQKRLMQAGYGATVQRHKVGGRDWYVVTAGHYPSKQAASNAAQRIGQRLGIHPAVRH